MDLADLLITLLPVVGATVACVVAFARRRRGPSPLVINRYTLVVAEQSWVLGDVSTAPPTPPAPAATG